VPPPKAEKLRTKGKFDVSPSTNGRLYSIERQWQIKANPYAHAATVAREELDKRLFQKKQLLQKQLEANKMLMAQQSQENH